MHLLQRVHRSHPSLRRNVPTQETSELLPHSPTTSRPRRTDDNQGGEVARSGALWEEGKDGAKEDADIGT